MTDDAFLLDEPFVFEPAAALAMIERYDEEGMAVVRLDWYVAGPGAPVPAPEPPATFLAPEAESWSDFKTAANARAREQVSARAGNADARVALAVIQRQEWRPFRL